MLFKGERGGSLGMGLHSHPALDEVVLYGNGLAILNGTCGVLLPSNGKLHKHPNVSQRVDVSGLGQD
jgi:hypothetical protein